MMRRFRLLILVVLAAVAVAPGAAQQRRTIAETDLFKFVWIADPQISPDGSQVAFVRVTVDDKKDQSDTSVWTMNTEGSGVPRQFTTGSRDSGPRWSPDGRRLAFIRAAEKDGKVQPPQVYVMDMAGGEPRAATEMPRGAGNPVWSPDGRTIAFASTSRPEELTPKATAADEKRPRESDVRVITEAVYRANGVAGSGYVDSDRPSQSGPWRSTGRHPRRSRSRRASSLPAITAGRLTAPRSTSWPNAGAKATISPTTPTCTPYRRTAARPG